MRDAARSRDGMICQMERRAGALATAYGTTSWFPCRHSGTQAAHIYRRRECGRAKYDPDVVVMACEDCHRRYDDDSDTSVRVRPEAEERAWNAISKASKVLPPRQSLTGQRL
jgi:5-methylcytosine-specific restriction endonuclease McrA